MPPTPPPAPEPTTYQLVRHPSYYLNAVEPGDGLQVHTVQGNLVQGTVLDITMAGVTLLCASCLQHVPMAQIERIQWLND